MLFKLKNSKKVVRDGFTAYVYNQKNDFSDLNTVYVNCHEFHERVYVKTSHRTYFVIEGAGIFNVGEDKYEVEAQDVIVIKPGVKYSYKGKMKLFEVNFPATDDKDEVVCE